MNWVDGVFLGILAAALLGGLLRGIGAQLISLISLLLAGLLALLFYPELADLLARVFDGVSRRGRETIAFLFLLIAMSNLINYAVRSSITPPEERRRQTHPTARGLEAALASGVHRFILAPLYMLGSMTLALVLTCLWFGLVTGVLRHSLALPWPAYDGIRVFLFHGLHGSAVVGLLDGAFRVAYTSVGPLMFEELNSPLTVLIRRFNQIQL